MVDVIPVVDLQGGVVVRAKGGRRELYAPIVTPLAPSSAPIDVVAGLLRIHPFRAIYVADLDAIEARGGQEQCLDSLSAGFPEVTFWIDAGIRREEEARSWLLRHSRAHLVLGSETLLDVASFEMLRGEERIILSLDFRGEAFLGPQALCDAPQLWPERVIAMTLACVGGDAGPDLDRLAALRARAPGAGLYAAGGVRGPADLARLTEMGVQGALVASALHEGRLTGADLVALERGEAGQAKQKGA